MQVTNKNVQTSELNKIKNNSQTTNTIILSDSLSQKTAFKGDSVKISSKTSQTFENVSLVPQSDVPVWSAKLKLKILSSFQAGLKKNNITEKDLSNILKTFSLSDMDITAENIQNPAFASEVKKIQEKLNKLLNNPELVKLGIKNKSSADGQFGATTVQNLIALRDTQRGEPVSLEVDNIRQKTKTGCYQSAKAMYFNCLIQKNSKDDAYNEFDVSKRISPDDIAQTEKYVGVTYENEKGRVTFPRSKGIELVKGIDNELDSGKPMVVGISRRKQDGVEYNEGITDHFLLITGRKYDENGVYYTFNDSAKGGSGVLRFDSVSGKLTGIGDMGQYDVTMACKYEISSEKVENYKKIGKMLYEPGASGSGIFEIQYQLNQIGYKTPMDKGYGKNLTANIKKFQDDAQLPVTGNIDTKTFSALQEKFRTIQESHPDIVMFQKGDKSIIVSELQTYLDKSGFKSKDKKGTFGPGTEKAVKDFQTAHGIVLAVENSGKIDNQTWLKLEEISNK